ncbi:MAG: hypothetical protein NTX09_17340 [Verrucomicrobia bacterium]|nr:hypothetical protein [Verrucomicrobiota bacterium]
MKYFAAASGLPNAEAIRPSQGGAGASAPGFPAAHPRLADAPRLPQPISVFVKVFVKRTTRGVIAPCQQALDFFKLNFDDEGLHRRIDSQDFDYGQSAVAINFRHQLLANKPA